MRHYQGVTQKFWVDDVLKNEKNNVSKSSLSQHVMRFLNAAGINGTCMGSGDVSPLMGSRNETLRAPTILGYLKSENTLK